MSLVDAVTAANRFGFGARPGELKAISSDPRGWVLAQLNARPQAAPAIESSAERARRLSPALRRNASKEDRKMLRQEAQKAYRGDVLVRARRAIEGETPFVERLVHFWSNHFTVSATRPLVAPLAGPFEDEAIRPHVTGRFVDMLRATARHPAMLIYLDNARSIGPNSPAGRRSGRGLNENYARELLELHTLGVDGGYTEDDVFELARILTGWTMGRSRDPDPGRFRFARFAHEPGAKILLDRVYDQGGAAEGEAALHTLARHPATAQHIASKLARHMIADEPPPGAVRRLADVFRETDGDLGALAWTLASLPETWANRQSKVRAPGEFVLAALRGTGLPPDRMRLPGTLIVLGQPTWMAPSPAGWPDAAEDWIGPESITKRIDWALAIAGPAAQRVDARALLEETVGPVASGDTRFHVAGAPSAAEAIALLLMSPEFQRR